MKKLNNQLNWRGFKGDMIGGIVQRKLKSDYSVRDKLDCPKSTNKSENKDKQIWEQFQFLACVTVNQYKRDYSLISDERVRAEVVYDFISCTHKAHIYPSTKLEAIETFIDEVLSEDEELKERLSLCLEVARIVVDKLNKIEKTADN